MRLRFAPVAPRARGLRGLQQHQLAAAADCDRGPPGIDGLLFQRVRGTVSMTPAAAGAEFIGHNLPVSPDLELPRDA